MVASGIDIVSTANNHSLDRGALGVDRTIDALQRAKLPFTGTRRQGDDAAAWHTITDVRGIKIAWLACTLHTNSIPDEHDQVLPCFATRNEARELVPSPMPSLVRKLAKRADVDAVIVTPHWGKEYEPQPVEQQQRLAQEVIDAGATAVIGSHPHVLQPWERMKAKDGREALVMYSLGNFASHQQDLPRRASIVLYLGLTKTAAGEVFVNGARYAAITVRMVGEQEKYFVEPVDPGRGDPEVYGHIKATMGLPNRLTRDEALRTNPQCWRDWKPAKF